MQQITNRRCMLPNAVSSRRSPLDRLPFCSPVGPYLDINKTTSLSWNPPLSYFPLSYPPHCNQIEAAQSHAYASFASQCTYPTHMTSAPQIMPPNFPTSSAPSCGPSHPAANSHSASYASPTTVRHNAFGSRKSSPHPVSAHFSDPQAGETDATTTGPIRTEEKKQGNQNGVTSPTSPSLRIADDLMPPSLLSRPLSHPRSPELSLTRSGSADIDIFPRGNSAEQSRRSATSLLTSNDVRETHQLKVMGNSLSIRRSRRARRPTVRSVTPSPPRNDPTDVTPWVVKRH